MKIIQGMKEFDILEIVPDIILSPAFRLNDANRSLYKSRYAVIIRYGKYYYRMFRTKELMLKLIKGTGGCDISIGGCLEFCPEHELQILTYKELVKRSVWPR